MSGSTLAKLVISLVWFVVASLAIAVAAEIFLKYRWEKRREVRQVGKERYDMLNRAYQPFAIQHVHPNYLFFFPFDPKDRVALSNEFVTIDSAGFRGQGPEFAGDRELAFLLGGSTAFSYSSADSTSITGYLNRLQERYHFVDAGVPSWNSSQELVRLTYQILEYNPSLVLTLDGANEMAILVQYHEQGLYYPPGTPESFGFLQKLVGDIRAGSTKPAGRGLIGRLFPRLSVSISAKLHPAKPVGPIPVERVVAAAKKYATNLEMMNTLVTAGGGRFAAIFQPIIWLHEHGPEQEEGYRYREDYRLFHRTFFADTTGRYERQDFSNMFDRHFDRIPYFEVNDGEDLNDSTLFLDPVHFFDRGNRMVAEEMISRFKLR